MQQHLTVLKTSNGETKSNMYEQYRIYKHINDEGHGNLVSLNIDHRDGLQKSLNYHRGFNIFFVSYLNAYTCSIISEKGKEIIQWDIELLWERHPLFCSESIIEMSGKSIGNGRVQASEDCMDWII